MLMTMPIGHTCVTVIMMEKWLFSHQKTKCYEKRRFERERTVKETLCHICSATQNWMPRVIILHFLFTDTATVNWTCAVMRDSLCVNCMHTWKRKFCFWYTFILNVLYLIFIALLELKSCVWELFLLSVYPLSNVKQTINHSNKKIEKGKNDDNSIDK